MADGGTTSVQFKSAAGDGKGFTLPTYNVENVPIVLNKTEKGYLVHEPVGLAGRAAGNGTGEIKSDAVVAYTKADFEAKYPKPESYVTLGQYKSDTERLAPLVYTTGRGNPNVETALDMQARLKEVGVDLTAFEAKRSLINDLTPRTPINTTPTIEYPPGVIPGR